MKAVAGFLSEDPARWEEIGILHDIDFECVKGDMQQHGVVGARLLKKAGIPDDICEIVRCHNHFLHRVPMTVRWRLHSRPDTHQAGLLPVPLSKAAVFPMSQ